IRAMSYPPYFWSEKDGERLSTQVKVLSLRNSMEATSVAALMNSSLFYWWFITLSDCRHLNMREVERFPVNLAAMATETAKNLHQICDSLMKSYQQNSVRKSATYRTTGSIAYDEYYPGMSKSIIDEIDLTIARHYDFSDQITDHLINFDIKFRMGAALFAEDEHK
ncbi:MAG: SAM-dependent methyltransferase, partial [Anaerolineales bacterium]